MGHLTPVGDAGNWAGGKLYYMPLSQDTFVHFAPKDRAEAIVASGKLLMNPPYPKSGIDVVAAVSAVWGTLVRRTQITHLIKHVRPDNPVVAVVFKTNVKPEQSYVEEVLWQRDVPLVGARIVPVSKGMAMLKNTPEQIGEDDMVTYEQAVKVAHRYLAARAIRIDKHRAKELAKELERVLARKARGDRPLGKRIIVRGAPYDITTVDGTPLTIYIRLQSIETESAYLIPGGGVGTASGEKVLVIWVNGSKPAEVVGRSARGGKVVESQIYNVLIHELTHAADKFTKGIGERMTVDDARSDLDTYYNDPGEVRAFMQEVVDEVLQSRGAELWAAGKFQELFGISKGFEYLLKMSQTWRDISPHLTERNKRLVIKAVAQALDDWEGRARRIAARYKQARQVRILIDVPATLQARAKFSAHPNGVVGEFDESIALYRVFDENELGHIVSSGTISGGSYSVKAERAHGASWGHNITSIVNMGNTLRGRRLGDRIYLAKIDGIGERFYHLDPGMGSEAVIPLDPDGPRMQPGRMDPERCNPGLGCSMLIKAADVDEFYEVDPRGQIHRKTIAELKAEAPAVEAPVEDVRDSGWGLRPKDKFEVSKGSKKLGIGIRNYGSVRDVWQDGKALASGDRRVNVSLAFTWPIRPGGRQSYKITLFTTHPNRLKDFEIPLMNSRGQRILIRKK